MARTFVQASSEYMEIASAVISAAPITMACWFNSASTTLTQFLISIGNSGSAAKFALSASGATGGDPIQAFASGNSANSASAYSANVWNHAVALFESTTSRYAGLNGILGTQNTTSTTPSGLNRTAIGRRNDSSPGSHMSGVIAHPAIWNAALTQAEITALAAGMSPLLVRPASLVAYWPLFGYASPEIDIRGRNELTLTGTTVAAEPRMFHSFGLRIGKPTTVAGGNKVPVMMNHYQRRRRA